jgi:hypothetical protein
VAVAPSRHGVAITGRVPLRAMPQVGGAVLVDFLGSSVAGVVRHVDVGRRRVEIVTETGEALTFMLNRATATFTTDGGQTGARLRFVNDG